MNNGKIDNKGHAASIEISFRTIDIGKINSLMSWEWKE